MFYSANNAKSADPVSYTQLDVYKRQAKRFTYRNACQTRTAWCFTASRLYAIFRRALTAFWSRKKQRHIKMRRMHYALSLIHI